MRIKPTKIAPGKFTYKDYDITHRSTSWEATNGTQTITGISLHDLISKLN